MSSNRRLYELNTGEIVRAGKDPDKCYFVKPNKPSITWASFAVVLKSRVAKGTARKLSKKEAEEVEND